MPGVPPAPSEAPACEPGYRPTAPLPRCSLRPWDETTDLATIAACGDARCRSPPMNILSRPRHCAVISCLFVSPALVVAQADAPRPLDTVIVTATRTPQSIANVLSDVRVIDQATINQAGPISLTELLQRHGGVEIAANVGPRPPAQCFLCGRKYK